MKFLLTYKKLIIGELSWDGKIWAFCYSKAFKKQDRIIPLIDFPDLEKVHTFQCLVPFFALRIPGLKQPKIQKVLAEEGLNKTDEAALLARFGEKCIANPFELRLLTTNSKTIQRMDRQVVIRGDK